MQKVTFQYLKRFGHIVEETFEFEDNATKMEIHQKRCDWGDEIASKEFQEMKQRGYGGKNDIY